MLQIGKLDFLQISAASKLKSMSNKLKTKAKLEDGADSLDYTTKSILLSTSNLLIGPMSISKGIKEDQGSNTNLIVN